MKKRRGRGEGSIIERPNGTWYAQISHTDAKGNRTRTTVTAATKSQVQKKLRERQTAIEKQGLAVTSQMTCEAFFTYWLRDVVAPSNAQSTHAAYDGRYRKWVLPMIGQIPINEIGVDQVNTVLRTLKDAGRSDTLRQNVRTMLSGAMSHAVARGLLRENPVASTVASSPPGSGDFVVYNQEQSLAFVAECRKHRLGPLWETAIQTGMRIGELLALKKQDVNLDGKVIHVRRTQSIGFKKELYIREPKTSAGVRAIAIGETLVNTIRKHLSETAVESEWVFSDASGRMLSRAAEPFATFKKIAKAVGVSGIHPHSLRHTHATLLLMAGVNLKIVSERLGHGDVAITLRTYSHFVPSMQAASAMEMDQLFSRLAADRQQK